MTLTILIPLAVLLLGLLLHRFDAKPTILELAKAMIWGGVFGLLILSLGDSIKLIVPK